MVVVRVNAFSSREIEASGSKLKINSTSTSWHGQRKGERNRSILVQDLLLLALYSRGMMNGIDHYGIFDRNARH